jgi:hypothetical protein
VRFSFSAYWLACATGLLFTSIAILPVCGAPLTGSGPHLSIPSPNPAWPPGDPPSRVATTAGFTGTWSSPVQPNWLGTYNATGPIPSSMAAGAVSYDFSTLPLGHLPAGTFFVFGDVDQGSTLSERFDLQAFDSSGNILSTPWLDETHAVTGSGASSSTIQPSDMPEWSWDAPGTSATYVIDGSSISGGNPNVAFALVSNQPIHALELNKATTHNGFVLQAPTAIPEPSTLVLGSLTLLGLWARRRR